MITASHNPAADNGYKIYWENGCQIITPHDVGISRAISENLAPWRDYNEIPSDSIDSLFQDITENAVLQYMDHVQKVLHNNSDELNEVSLNLTSHL